MITTGDSARMCKASPARRVAIARRIIRYQRSLPLSILPLHITQAQDGSLQLNEGVPRAAATALSDCDLGETSSRLSF